jgi:hypothetical protein
LARPLVPIACASGLWASSPVPLPWRPRRWRHAAERLGAGGGGQRSASTIGAVWRFAQEGRGQTLIVEDDDHVPARINAPGLLDLDMADPDAPDVLDHAVDEVVTAVLEKGEQIVVVADGEREQPGRSARILRS